MRAIIADNNWIYFDNITVHEEEILWNEFSVSKKNAYIDPSQTQWDGVHRKYNRTKKRVTRPLLSMVNKICKKHKLPLVVEDRRQKWDGNIDDPNNIDIDYISGIKLENYQIKPLKIACRTECGLFKLPTGAGKSIVICGLCKAIDCPTVILSAQRIVIDQLKSHLLLRDITDNVGIFYAGIKPNGQKIVVGSVQSLSLPPKPPTAPERKLDESDSNFNKRWKRWETSLAAYKTRKTNARELQEYIKNAGMLIVDEADQATSSQYKYVFRHLFRGRRRYGLSGTPLYEDDPVQAMVVQEHLGSIIFEESKDAVQALGRIIPCEYYMMAFGTDGDKRDRTAYDIAFAEWIINNQRFHKLIAGICKQYCTDGTLILVDKQELGIKLVEAIKAVGMTAKFIFGKTPKKQRNLVVKEFEERKINVLIGGKIINRGFDLKGGCENLIIATGGKKISDFKQKLGRALRINVNGKSRVFDFLFLCNQYLYKHSKARLKAIIELNYLSKIIFPYCKIDGAKFIDSGCKIPKIK